MVEGISPVVFFGRRPWHLATTPMYGIGNGIALPVDPTFNPVCRHNVDGRALALNYAV